MCTITEFYNLPVAQKIEKLEAVSDTDKSAKVWMLNLQFAVRRRRPTIVSHNNILSMCYDQIVAEIDK